jgi:carbon monoxide dehydrogenase subunit G
LNINESAVVSAPIDDVWKFIVDVPRIGACLPGAEGVKDLGNGQFGGAVRVKVGAISVRLEGKVQLLEQDEERHVAVLTIEASDRRIKGSVNAECRLQLTAVDAGTTEMSVATDAAVVGKLGQFGQAVIQKKTRQMLDEFVVNVGNQLNPDAAGIVTEDAYEDARVAVGSGGASEPIGVSGARNPARPGARAAAQPQSASGWQRASAVVALAGVVVGFVGATKSEPDWVLFGLCLVIWGALGSRR